MDRTVSIAPMMDVTNRHFRRLMRLLTHHTLLYTEMITAQALIHGNQKKLLYFTPKERPLALQLGGCDPNHLAVCAKMAEEAGYDEVNLNVGCPSDRVQQGRFGACLMREPDLVARCVEAMCQAVSMPVTVKTRIGVDDHDSYEALKQFIQTVSAAGCEVFIIHARKAWLKGLNPKENREIPPLRYDVVKQLVADFPALAFVLNGGIGEIEDAFALHRDFAGIMMGRAAYQDPYALSKVDSLFYGDFREVLSPQAIIHAFIPYMDQELAAGTRLATMTRHLLMLFKHCKGAKQWRRILSEQAHKALNLDVIYNALSCVEECT